MNPLSLKITGWITLILIIVISAFSAGWKVKGWKDDSQYKEAYAGVVDQVKKQDLMNQKISKEYQSNSSLYNKKMEGLNELFNNEIKQHHIYNECDIPDSGVQLINAAVDSANKVKSSR